jgi:O-antigen ligase
MSGFLALSKKVYDDYWDFKLDVTFFCASGYFILFALLCNGSVNLKTILVVQGLLLIPSLRLLISEVKPDLQVLCNIIIALAVFECFTVFGQFFGFIDSNNEYFKVTGTWDNPNVIAMFLTIALPVVLIKYRTGNLGTVGAAMLTLTFLLSIFLLGCRTAILGIALGGIIVLIRDKQIMARWLTVQRKPLFIAFLLLFGIGLSYLLYLYKKDSADGRLVIWLRSTGMFFENPIMGIGLGNFEREYNLHQAQYFSKLTDGNFLVEKGSFIKMAYNELLQTFIEVGIAGIVVLGFTSAVLIGNLRRKRIQHRGSKELYIAIYAGVAAFLAMSMVNFTIEALPVLAVFITYISLLASRTTAISNETKTIRKDFSGSTINFWRKPTQSCVVIFTSILFFVQFSNAKSFIKFSRIFTGQCYEEMGDMENARMNFMMARNMIPNQITPKFYLLRMYIRNKETQLAINIAHEMLSTKVTIFNQKNQTYLAIAKKFLGNKTNKNV